MDGRIIENMILKKADFLSCRTKKLLVTHDYVRFVGAKIAIRVIAARGDGANANAAKRDDERRPHRADDVRSLANSTRGGGGRRLQFAHSRLCVRAPLAHFADAISANLQDIGLLYKLKKHAEMFARRF